jgi:hypothetical protein
MGGGKSGRKKRQAKVGTLFFAPPGFVRLPDYLIRTVLLHLQLGIQLAFLIILFFESSLACSFDWKCFKVSLDSLRRHP